MKNLCLSIIISLIVLSCNDKKINKTDAPINNQKEYLCEDVIIEIIESSNENKEEKVGLIEFIKKNGGDSYGFILEACPNPKEDYLQKSDYYEFNFHVNYPDRIEVISRYRFNPKDLVLEVWNPIDDTYSKIEHDSNLNTKFKACKN